ncbi:hypothetical protein BKA93DRAFT_753055 [Sparassis latifolia]
MTQNDPMEAHSSSLQDGDLLFASIQDLFSQASGQPHHTSAIVQLRGDQVRPCLVDAMIMRYRKFVDEILNDVFCDGEIAVYTPQLVFDRLLTLRQSERHHLQLAPDDVAQPDFNLDGESIHENEILSIKRSSTLLYTHLALTLSLTRTFQDVLMGDRLAVIEAAIYDLECRSQAQHEALTDHDISAQKTFVRLKRILENHWKDIESLFHSSVDLDEQAEHDTRVTARQSFDNVGRLVSDLRIEVETFIARFHIKLSRILSTSGSRVAELTSLHALLLEVFRKSITQIGPHATAASADMPETAPDSDSGALIDLSFTSPEGETTHGKQYPASAIRYNGCETPPPAVDMLKGSRWNSYMGRAFNAVISHARARVMNHWVSLQWLYRAQRVWLLNATSRPLHSLAIAVLLTYVWNIVDVVFFKGGVLSHEGFASVSN